MSNKTPRPGGAAIASAPKHGNLTVILCIAAALFIILAVSYFPRNSLLNINGHIFTYTLAQTQTQIEKGLSNKTFLPENEAMVFVFAYAGQHCFWMKDMNFPLDIVWLSEDKQVIALKQNVSPSTYPETFCPNQSSKYTIELNSGMVHKTGLKTGAKVNF